MILFLCIRCVRKNDFFSQVIFLMLLSYCVARSIDENVDVLDTPTGSLSEPTSDLKTTDEIVDGSDAKV